MVDDIERDIITKYYPIQYQPTDLELHDALLQELEQILIKNSFNIHSYNLPKVSLQYRPDKSNQLIDEELNYHIDMLDEQANRLYMQLNTEQKNAYQQIISSVLKKEPNIFFVSGHGGTGKTFLWNTIVCYLRAQKKKCTNCCIIRSCVIVTSKWTYRAFTVSHTNRYR